MWSEGLGIGQGLRALALVIVALAATGIGRASPTLAAGASETPSDHNRSYLSPEVLSSHVVFSPQCAKILYTSNRDGLLRPFVIDMSNRDSPKASPIRIDQPLDFVAQGLAPDCRTLALVSDREGNGSFDVYLYDLKTHKLQGVAIEPALDEGSPAFAPRDRILAYLSGGSLALFDYVKSMPIAVKDQPATFRSLTWSEDGNYLYLEDERSNLSRYDLRKGHFQELWNAPRLSYSPHTISEHDHHILFASDHESDYSQIYRLEPESGALERLYDSPRDKHSPIELASGHYAFRTVTDSSFIVSDLDNGKYRTLSPPMGVAYDFSLDFGKPLLFYSNDRLPTSFYWYQTDKLTPLIPESGKEPLHQPDAIPIRNADGVANFLYLPSKHPRGWVIWLHGGPYEEVSPRFNLYFDFLAARNIAVYAINYPGSAGNGRSYALAGKVGPRALEIQVPAVERDVRQLKQLHPEIKSLMLIGVSYGSIIGHTIVAKDPEIARFIDFSGVANTTMIYDVGSSNRLYPPMLVIYGENDYTRRNSYRLDLISRYREHATVASLAIPNEGHFIQHRDSIDRILDELDRFLIGGGE